MSRPDRYFDWHRVAPAGEPPPAVDPRGRLRLVLWVIAALAGAVFARVVALECSSGTAYRAQAARLSGRRERVPAVRGRILARDGTVLACDHQVVALAVHYRYLEQPPDQRWLAARARARLPPPDRAQRARVAAEESRVLEERDDLHRRLAALCGLSPGEFTSRVREIQARVTRISDRVNGRRREPARRAELRPPTARIAPPPGPPSGQTVTATAADPARPAPAEAWWERLVRLAGEALAAPEDDTPRTPLVVVEELDYHVILDNLPRRVGAEIRAHPQRYPGVRIERLGRRRYPAGPLAAHVLGHVGRVEEEHLAQGRARSGGHAREGGPYGPGDWVGKLGVEQQYERTLRGTSGVSVERLNKSGRVLWTRCERQPAAGRDLVLTLDLALQRTAESLLDSALARRTAGRAGQPPQPAGGAIVVMDVRTGAILASASAPRFDPSWFAAGRTAELKRLLSDPADPLFDRATRMAAPPGSVFKILSAVALLESGTVEPDEPFYCQGYLDHPERLRCLIYRRSGTGHGDTTLVDALARSCNVYFFHFARRMGPAPLVDWAWRFGLGRPTGVDLPGEAAGFVPTPANPGPTPGKRWSRDDTQALAIGQSTLGVTPLQAARLVAAVANGGKLVTPHVVSRVGPPERDAAGSASKEREKLMAPAPGRAVEGLRSSTLEVVRRGLLRAVADRSGTAHGSVRLDSVAIAGKTGTAQTGAGRADHAWFAGYAPADSPRVAFVVMLEHAGGGAEAAGPVARRLVAKLEKLGYFSTGL